MILLLGVGAAYLLMRASPAVATIAGVLITTGLLGLVILTRVVAAHSSGPRRDDGVGPGHARPELILVRPNVDAEMELYRILDDDRFGNISTGRAANTHDRRRRAV